MQCGLLTLHRATFTERSNIFMRSTPIILAVGLVIGWSAAGMAQCRLAPKITPRQTLESLFAALKGEDRAAVERLTTTDFRAFERGRILDRDGFFGLVQQAHRQGLHLQWSVTDERVALACEVAVMNYVNKGSINGPGSSQDMSWLEVAAFRRTPTGWKVNFVESQRVEPQPAKP